MNRSLKWFFFALPVLLTGGLVAGYFLLTEDFQEEVFVPAKGPARHNPFYALERMLVELGLTVSHTHGSLGDPKGYDQIFWLASDPPSDDVMEAVRENSVSLLTVTRPEEQWRKDMKRIGVAEKLEVVDAPMSSSGEPSSEVPANSEQLDGAASSAGVEPPVQSKQMPPADLDAPRTGPAAQGAGDRSDCAQPGSPGAGKSVTVAHFRLGLEGHVTVLSGDAWLKNDCLAAAGNAERSWQEIRRAGTWGTILFVERHVEASFLQGLVGRFWLFACVFVSGMVALLWRGWLRVGPRRQISEASGLDFIDHVAASGRFIDRQGATDALLQEVRLELLARSGGSHVSSLPGEEEAQSLALRAGVPLSTVKLAMMAQHDGSQQSLTRIARAMQTFGKQ